MCTYQAHALIKDQKIYRVNFNVNFYLVETFISKYHNRIITDLVKTLNFSNLFKKLYYYFSNIAYKIENSIKFGTLTAESEWLASLDKNTVNKCVLGGTWREYTSNNNNNIDYQEEKSCQGKVHGSCGWSWVYVLAINVYYGGWGSGVE